MILVSVGASEDSIANEVPGTVTKVTIEAFEFG
jgi:hypothetical protein